MTPESNIKNKKNKDAFDPKKNTLNLKEDKNKAIHPTPIKRGRGSTKKFIFPVRNEECQNRKVVEQS